MVPFCSNLAGEIGRGCSDIRLRRRRLCELGGLSSITLALAIALPLAIGSSRGAWASEAPVRANARSSPIDAWLARQATLRSWSAEFLQTRTLKTLTQPLTARGRLWFSAPDRFRWELGSPPMTVAIRQPKQLFVIYPELKRAERYPLATGEPGQWGSALALLEAGFPRGRADLESKFRITNVQQTNEVLTLRLAPKSASARRLIPRIEIVLSKDFSLRATELEFGDGSTLRNDFTQARLNPAIDEALFVPELDSGYKLIEPLKK